MCNRNATIANHVPLVVRYVPCFGATLFYPTIFDEDLLSSHSADVLNISVDSSLHNKEDDYAQFPPTQLCERGDVFTSLAEGHDAYREAAFAAPPSEEGAANNQVFTDMPFTGAKNQR